MKLRAARNLTIYGIIMALFLLMSAMVLWLAVVGLLLNNDPTHLFGSVDVLIAAADTTSSVSDDDDDDDG